MNDSIATMSPPIVPADHEPGLRCPLCDYDLRGLVEPRCPECGYGAESWDILRLRIRTSHPFLFEHHPERSRWSFLRTLAAGMNPWSFWRSVQPHHEVRLARLVRYWLAVNLLVIAALVPLYAYGCLALHRHNAAQRPVLMASYRAVPKNYATWVLMHGSIEAAIDAWYPVGLGPRLLQLAYRYNGPLRGATALLLALATWPWLVVLTMHVFRTTLRAARVRPGHVVRCAVYACDLHAWLLALPLAGWGAWLGYDWLNTAAVPSLFDPSFRVVITLGAVALAALVLIALRLAVALRRYLRLRHAVTTALLVQVIVLLAFLTFILPLLDF